jgi:hypothetical protein
VASLCLPNTAFQIVVDIIYRYLIVKQEPIGVSLVRPDLFIGCNESVAASSRAWTQWNVQILNSPVEISESDTSAITELSSRKGQGEREVKVEKQRRFEATLNSTTILSFSQDAFGSENTLRYTSVCVRRGAIPFSASVVWIWARVFSPLGPWIESGTREATASRSPFFFTVRLP